MRTDLSEEADATMGRDGCGTDCQERVVEGGVRVARGVMVRGRLEGVGSGIFRVCVWRKWMRLC